MLLHPKSQQPQPPAKKGRASGFNTPNRFEQLHHEPDPLEPDDEDYRDKVPTQFLVDSSKSILVERTLREGHYRRYAKTRVPVGVI